MYEKSRTKPWRISIEALRGIRLLAKRSERKWHKHYPTQTETNPNTDNETNNQPRLRKSRRFTTKIADEYGATIEKSNRSRYFKFNGRVFVFPTILARILLVLSQSLCHTPRIPKTSNLFYTFIPREISKR